MKSIIIANWKCNPGTLAEAEKLFNSLNKGVKNAKKVDVVICPPFVYLPYILNTKYKVHVGAQDCFWSEGAYTGEVSAAMLKNLGVEYVILGHSERRKNFGETEEMIGKKLQAARKSGLKPILCVEKASQIPQNCKDLIVAFEPASAISGGGAFNPYPLQKAREMRESLVDFPMVLYGGSVNSQNARDYIFEAGFEGLLAGKASLDSKEIIEIVKAIC